MSIDRHWLAFWLCCISSIGMITMLLAAMKDIVWLLLIGLIVFLAPLTSMIVYIHLNSYDDKDIEQNAVKVYYEPI
jgi:ABC-type spermidine/putrescine transport system permease subunit II